MEGVLCRKSKAAGLSEKGGFKTLKGGDRRELLVSVGKNFPETAAKAVEAI